MAVDIERATEQTGKTTLRRTALGLTDGYYFYPQVQTPKPGEMRLTLTPGLRIVIQVEATPAAPATPG